MYVSGYNDQLLLKEVMGSLVKSKCVKFLSTTL